ncbi:MAG: penicillin-binding protein 2 [Patescibacteria group bacterium]|jgi:penicillin-binding protein 2
MGIFRKNKIRSNDPFAIQEIPVRDFRLNEDRNLDWIEESFEVGNSAEAVVGENESGQGMRKEFLGLALNQKRLTVFLIFIFGILGILFGRTAYLQIICGEHFREMAEGNRIRTIYTAAERGIIYDRNLNVLVKNVPTFSLYLIPTDFPKDAEEKMSAIENLAKVTNIPPKEIEEKLSGASSYSYSPTMLRENIDYEEAIRLKIESSFLSGIDLKLESRREYLNGENFSTESMSHILGYVGKVNQKDLEQHEDYNSTDFIGKTGLELFYEELLRGENGKRQVEVDALGKEKSVIAKEDPVRGENITLTLDIDVQKKMEQIIKKHLTAAKKSRAAAIVIDPENGEILAMVSLPAFDNNLFAKGISSEEYGALRDDPNYPFLNRAVMGEYPSGSTIKPVIASAALEEGIINRNTSFLSVGGLRVSSWFFPDWLAGGHGLTNVTKAIADSVNTFFYIIGGGYDNFEGLGVARIVEYAKLFGFGEKLGVDLPNEAEGFLPTEEWKEKTKNEQWYIGDTYHLAIGQGDLLVTPLQIAVSTTVFANGGALYRPHFLKTVGSEKASAENYLIRENFISKENIDIIRAGMRQTVTSGSAKKLLDLPVTSAGKTGTAQWSTTKSPHAWFTAFAPFQNPEISVTVLVEEGEEGSRITLDIAREFMMWYFSR